MAAKKKPAKAKKPSVARTKRTPKKTAVDWAPRFLATLSATSNILESCKRAKVGRTTVYERRESDPAFARRMAEALDDACDLLELEARRRALDGCERPVFHQGEECGRIREYSDTLMIFLLKAHRPEKYRERLDHRHSGPDGGPIKYESLTDTERADRVAALLDAARARRDADVDGGVGPAPVGALPGPERPPLPPAPGV